MVSRTEIATLADVMRALVTIVVIIFLWGDVLMASMLIVGADLYDF